MVSQDNFETAVRQVSLNDSSQREEMGDGWFFAGGKIISKEGSNMKKVKCPICSHPVEIADFLEIGNTIDCMQCDSVLRIVKLDPPQLEVDSLGEYGEDDFNEEEEY